MPLLLLDLDNTLVDRAGAVRRWTIDFLTPLGRHEPHEIEWLVAADADGYERRDTLAERIRERFELGPQAFETLQQDLRWGMADYLELDPAVAAALGEARDEGWTLAVITNGTVEQQERKMRLTGLVDLVDGCTISEAVGAKKPDPAIFEAAARDVGAGLDGAWMIGDSGQADIAGATRLGLDSVWLHRGRAWIESSFHPRLIADDCPAAIWLAINDHGFSESAGSEELNGYRLRRLQG